MPTVYAELNAVLGELVETVRTTLGENFCGAYLQGSFALSHADADSDVDFIVVTRDEVTDAQLDALQDMHRRIYALPSPWAQHLEGVVRHEGAPPPRRDAALSALVPRQRR